MFRRRAVSNSSGSEEGSEEILEIARKAKHQEDRLHLKEFAIKLHETAKNAIKHSYESIIPTPYGAVIYKSEKDENGAKARAFLDVQMAHVYEWPQNPVRRSKDRKRQKVRDSYYRLIHSRERHEVSHLATNLRRPCENLNDALIHELASVGSESLKTNAETRVKNWLRNYAKDENHALNGQLTALVERTNVLGVTLRKYGKMKLSTILSDPEIKTLDDAEQVITHLEKNISLLGQKRAYLVH